MSLIYEHAANGDPVAGTKKALQEYVRAGGLPRVAIESDDNKTEFTLTSAAMCHIREKEVFAQLCWFPSATTGELRETYEFTKPDHQLYCLNVSTSGVVRRRLVNPDGRFSDQESRYPLKWFSER